MWLSRFSPYIWLKFTRFSLWLWMVPLLKLCKPCGNLLDNLSTGAVHKRRLFLSFPYFGFYEYHPLNMGVTHLQVVQWFRSKKPLLSTGEGTFPQIIGTYPQFCGDREVDLSEQETQDMGCRRDISDSLTLNMWKISQYVIHICPQGQDSALNDALPNRLHPLRQLEHCVQPLEADPIYPQPWAWGIDRVRAAQRGCCPLIHKSPCHTHGNGRNIRQMDHLTRCKKLDLRLPSTFAV